MVVLFIKFIEHLYLGTTKTFVFAMAENDVNLDDITVEASGAKRQSQVCYVFCLCKKSRLFWDGEISSN